MDSKILLYAGLTVPCTFRDDTKGHVKLRLIRISEIPEFLDIALDETKSLAFCIDEPAQKSQADALAFIDTLTDESFIELTEKNTELNFTRALDMTDQRLKRSQESGVKLAQLAGSLASLLSRYSPKSDSPAVSPANSS